VVLSAGSEVMCATYTRLLPMPRTCRRLRMLLSNSYSRRDVVVLRVMAGSSPAMTGEQRSCTRRMTSASHVEVRHTDRCACLSLEQRSGAGLGALRLGTSVLHVQGGRDSCHGQALGVVPSLMAGTSPAHDGGGTVSVEGRSDVEVRDLQGVADDEVAPWLDHVAHQRGEDLCCVLGIADFHL
jgi:hypothetical protein